MDSVDKKRDVLRGSTEVLCSIEVDVCSDVGDTSGVLFLRVVLKSDVSRLGPLLVVSNDVALVLPSTVVSGNVVCLSGAVEIRPSVVVSGIIVSTNFLRVDEVMDSVENRVDFLRGSTELLCSIKVNLCSDVGDTSGMFFVCVDESVKCLFGFLLVVGNDGAFDISCTVVSGNIVCLSVAVEK